LSGANNELRTGRQLKDQPQKPGNPAGPPAPDQESTSDARSATLNRIRKTLVTSRLTFAGETAGKDPYDSRRGSEPGAVWRNRIR
jgi:hypothetical protein